MRKKSKPVDKVWTVQELEEYGRIYTPEKHQAYLMYVLEEKEKEIEKRRAQYILDSRDERAKDPFTIYGIHNLFNRGYSIEKIAATFLLTYEQVERIIANKNDN